MEFSLFTENTKYELLHQKTKEPTGLVLEIKPVDHDDVYVAKMDLMKSLRQSGSTEISADALIEAGVKVETKINMTLASIAGWEVTSEQDQWKEVFSRLGFKDEVDVIGKVIAPITAYTPEKCRALLSMPTAGWIRSQVDTVIYDQERFFKQASHS